MYFMILPKGTRQLGNNSYIVPTPSWHEMPNGLFRIQTFYIRLESSYICVLFVARWSILKDTILLLGLIKVEATAKVGFELTTLRS